MNNHNLSAKSFHFICATIYLLYRNLINFSAKKVPFNFISMYGKTRIKKELYISIFINIIYLSAHVSQVYFVEYIAEPFLPTKI